MVAAATSAFWLLYLKATAVHALLVSICNLMARPALLVGFFHKILIAAGSFMVHSWPRDSIYWNKIKILGLRCDGQSQLALRSLLVAVPSSMV